MATDASSKVRLDVEPVTTTVLSVVEGAAAPAIAAILEVCVSEGCALAGAVGTGPAALAPG